MHLFLALTLVVSQQFPKDASDLEGLYVIRRGLENIQIELLAGGSLTMAQQYDHPGDFQWKGKWEFKNEKLQVVVKYPQGDKMRQIAYSWVPLVWGDRLMLVDETEVREGIVGQLVRQDVERLHDLGKRDDNEMTYTKLAVRVAKRDDKLPLRYGKIVATEEFEAYFADVDLRLPKKS